MVNFRYPEKVTEDKSIKATSYPGSRLFCSNRCRGGGVASVSAAEECQVLTLDWERIQRLATFHPRTSAALFRNLSEVIGDRFRESLDSMESGCQQPDRRDRRP